MKKELRAELKELFVIVDEEMKERSKKEHEDFMSSLPSVVEPPPLPTQILTIERAVNGFVLKSNNYYPPYICFSIEEVHAKIGELFGEIEIPSKPLK